MTTGTAEPHRARSRPARQRDAGVSLIEILIAIVLLGTAAVSVVGALQVSIIGTRLERDHAKAYQWLQSSDGVLQAAARVGCDFNPVLDAPYTSGEQKARIEYQNLIRAGVVNPSGWDDSQIIIIPPIKVWDGNQYWDPYSAGAPKQCFDSDGYLLQLITLQVESPDGDIIETIQVVKRD
jgi:prepilin-type N-terminal cleavage/methylation domain-containing protein